MCKTCKILVTWALLMYTLHQHNGYDKLFIPQLLVLGILHFWANFAGILPLLKNIYLTTADFLLILNGCPLSTRRFAMILSGLALSIDPVATNSWWPVENKWLENKTLIKKTIVKLVGISIPRPMSVTAKAVDPWSKPLVRFVCKQIHMATRPESSLREFPTGTAHMEALALKA